MASALSMARLIQLKHGEQCTHIKIFDDDDIDDLARYVKNLACVAFNFNPETVEQVTFHESATLDDGETVQFTHMPADIVKAYIDKFGSDDRSRMFKLDVQFKHSGSEPTGQRVSAAAVGASQHPEAGREGPNDVKAHCGLTRKMQGTMRKTCCPYSSRSSRPSWRGPR